MCDKVNAGSYSTVYYIYCTLGNVSKTSLTFTAPLELARRREYLLVIQVLMSSHIPGLFDQTVPINQTKERCERAPIKSLSSLMIREEICASVSRGGLYSNLVYLPITRRVLARITRLRTR